MMTATVTKVKNKDAVEIATNDSDVTGRYTVYTEFWPASERKTYDAHLTFVDAYGDCAIEDGEVEVAIGIRSVSNLMAVACFFYSPEKGKIRPVISVYRRGKFSQIVDLDPIDADHWFNRVHVGLSKSDALALYQSNDDKPLAKRNEELRKENAELKTQIADMRKQLDEMKENLALVLTHMKNHAA